MRSSPYKFINTDNPRYVELCYIDLDDSRYELYWNKKRKRWINWGAKVYISEGEDSYCSEVRWTLETPWFSLNVPLFNINCRDNQDKSWDLGVSTLDEMILLGLGRKTHWLRIPFVTQVHVKREVLDLQGQPVWFENVSQFFKSKEKWDWDFHDKLKQENSASLPFQCQLVDELQERVVTFYLTRNTYTKFLLPSFLFGESTTYLNYTFDKEVGAASGSYKGGVISSAVVLDKKDTIERAILKLEDHYSSLPLVRVKRGDLSQCEDFDA